MREGACARSFCRLNVTEGLSFVATILAAAKFLLDTTA
jgi:hypothetical protein